MVADADQRELYISVGCALENLLIAAEHFKYAHHEEYFPENEDSLVAVVKLAPTEKSINLGTHYSLTRYQTIYQPQQIRDTKNT